MKYQCPCCGYATFENEPDGNYDICPVCFWEDDPFQAQDPDMSGGANGVSLNEARANFAKFGACEERFVGNVRAPKGDEIPAEGLEKIPRRKYPTEQLEAIKMHLLELVKFVQEQDKRDLPRCFEYCKLILKNIDICINSEYEGIEELTEVIQRDWKNVLENHSGLAEYYIPNENFVVQKSLNEQLAQLIWQVDEAVEL